MSETSPQQLAAYVESNKQRLIERWRAGVVDRLGLTIVKQAVESHHGSVRVANRPGEGCTFVLDLPRYQAASKLA